MSNKPTLLEEVKQYFLNTPKSQILEDWESVVHTEKVKLINEVISKLEKTDGVKTPITWEEKFGTVKILCSELLESEVIVDVWWNYSLIFAEKFDLGLLIKKNNDL